MILHNSQLPEYRHPLGPVTTGSRVTLRLLCEGARSVTLHTWMGGDLDYAMDYSGNDIWETTLQVPDETGNMWYDFRIEMKDGKNLIYGNARDAMGGEGSLYGANEYVSSYQLVIYDADYQTPAFMHGANIYQIFPDRFFKAESKSVDTRTNRVMHKSWDEEINITIDERGNYSCLDFYGGNLNGIREKLPYLVKLGVTVLYLNPIFEARSNHRYDTGDYSHIDALLGTDEEFTELCDAAREVGINIMLDGVFSHTGEDSIYFNRFGTYDSLGAWQSKKSSYSPWYTFENFPSKYRCWWGIPTLPEIRKEDPKYRSYMFNPSTGIVGKWIKAGASGWRLDVADELPMSFLRELRIAAKKANPEAVVLGEVWEDASNKVAYEEARNYCTGDTLDSVMNYPLRTAILDFVSRKSNAKDLCRLINHQAEVYPVPFRYSLMNLLGSHDRARAANMLVDKESDGMSIEQRSKVVVTDEEYKIARERYLTCVKIICALPGCPTIYYGDEVGMTGTPDPYCRRPYPWGKGDQPLHDAVAVLLRKHRASNVLRYGDCKVTAVDDDTIRIERTIGKTDVFGHAAERPEMETIIIRR